MNEEQVLCACSAYEEKYYFNPRFDSLPAQIQEELKKLFDAYITGAEQ